LKPKKKCATKKISKKTPAPKATSSKTASEGEQPISDDDEVIVDDIKAEMDELDPSKNETLPKKKQKKKVHDDSPTNIKATAYIFIIIPYYPSA
jgi:hypothetical protein